MAVETLSDNLKSLEQFILVRTEYILFRQIQRNTRELANERPSNVLGYSSSIGKAIR